MNKKITYNSATYTVVKENQLSVVKNNKEYTLTLENTLKKGEMIQLVPVLDELLAHEIIGITTIH